MKIDWKSKQTRGFLALVAFGLAVELATLAVYVQTAHYDFVNFDDSMYVYKNPTVTAGITAAGALWAFTTLYFYNWQPLTWLSHMLDCQLFGLDAGAHHLVNLAFHLASTLLLFLALARMTGKPWRSAFLAAVFALHPLHVESVAWISERKDVLSGFFTMLTLLLYARYAELPSLRRYAPMVLAFALGLMAKPMLVTLPFVLLLLDVWPLRRITWPVTDLAVSPALKRVLWEKAPLLAMAAAVSLLTVLAHAGISGQKYLEQPVTFAPLPFSARLANAVTTCVAYLGKAFFPADLAVFYPYHPPSAGYVLAAVFLLTAITLVCLRLAQRRPYLLVGWLWYLGMLVPVSGLVITGVQSMADRFMYLPLIGLSIAVVWGAADLAETRRFLPGLTAIAAGAALALLAAGTYRQAGYWKDTRTLYEHTLEITTGNFIIHNNLGAALEKEGKRDAAMAHYRQAIALLPVYVAPRVNLGRMLVQSGKLEEAITELTEAERLASEQDPKAEGYLCRAFYELGSFDAAALHCYLALRLDPGYMDALYYTGLTNAAMGRTAEAAAEFSSLLAASPDFPGARAALSELHERRSR